MDRHRLTIALVVALLLSGAVTFFLSHRINARVRKAAPQVTLSYVAASRALLPGEVLKADNLTLIEWPAKFAPEGAFSKLEELLGRAVIYPIAARQPILQTYLAGPGSGVGLVAKIPDGMRTTSLRSDEIVGVAGFLFPGSRVDVLVTFRGDAIPVPGTQIVLQDVEVLTVGQKTDPDPGGKAETVDVVTLLLTPQDAQKVVLASTLGSIHFVLRNGSDRGHVEATPVTVAHLIGHGPSLAARPAAAAKKSAYVVETVMGDKRTTNEFEN